MTSARHTVTALVIVCAIMPDVFARSKQQQRSPTDATLQGAWVGKTYHGILTMKLNLRADHRLEWSVDSPEMINTPPVLGTWQLRRGRLAFRWDDHTEDFEVRIFELTTDT